MFWDQDILYLSLRSIATLEFRWDLDFSQVIMRCQVMRRSVSHFIGCVNLHEPQKDLVLSLHVALF